VTFVGTFEPKFALLLRERRSTDLTRIQDDAIKIESNMMESGKIKEKFETGTKETKLFREQDGTSRSGKSVEDKMGDMAKIIKELSKKSPKWNYTKLNLILLLGEISKGIPIT
jgi:hypothetical protein